MAKSEMKTKKISQSVSAFLNTISEEKKRADAKTIPSGLITG